MNFRLWIEAGEAQLDYLLLPPGKISLIGKERGKVVNDGITRFISPHGSYRYVFYMNGQPVSALQVMSRDKKNAVIANVYTAPEYRRQRYASQLFQKAKQDFQTVAQAEHRTKEGDAWANVQESFDTWANVPTSHDYDKIMDPQEILNNLFWQNKKMIPAIEKEDEKYLANLEQSVLKHEWKQPIKVKMVKDQYYIDDGMHRFIVALKLGKPIPVKFI